jgi:hypothetical protein
MDEGERPGPPLLTGEDVAQEPLLSEASTTGDEECPGPPPLTEEDVVQGKSPSDFEPTRRTDTEGLELDRSTFTATASRVKEAPSLPDRPAEKTTPAREVVELMGSDIGRLLGTGVVLLLALVVCVLPRFWRDPIKRRFPNLPLCLATVITGIVEMTAAFFVGLQEVVGFMESRLKQTAPVLMDHVLKHEVSPQTMHEMYQAQGAILWISFILSPLGFLLAFVMSEGAARIVAAVVAKEAWGTLPLWLVEKVRWLAASLLQRSRRKPLPPDTIVKAGQATLVSIQSAHGYAWDHTTTLRFEGRLYVVDEQSSTQDHERPYLYRLREAPMGHLIRKLTEYKPTPLDTTTRTGSDHPARE